MRKLLIRAMASLCVLASAGIGGAAMSWAAPAAACTYPFAAQTADQCWPPSTVPTQAVIRTPPAPDGPTATVSGSTTLAQTTGSLAFTGADIWQTALVGGGLIGGGLVLVRLSRRRRRTV